MYRYTLNLIWSSSHITNNNNNTNNTTTTNNNNNITHITHITHNLNMSSTGSALDEEAIDALFNSLADEDDTESMNMDGIASLSEMLDMDPTTDVRLLVLLWKMAGISRFFIFTFLRFYVFTGDFFTIISMFSLFFSFIPPLHLRCLTHVYCHLHQTSDSQWKMTDIDFDFIFWTFLNCISLTICFCAILLFFFL